MPDRVVMRSHGGVGEISAPRRHVASLIEKGWTPVESKPDPKPAAKTTSRKSSAKPENK